jgi:glutamate carboxypeptidase
MMEQRLLRYLEATEQEQFRLLERLTLQSSHSTDKKGVDRVGVMIREALSECHLRLTIDRVESHGDNLVFQSAACASQQPHILLVGHMDTVFPPESRFNTYREDGVKAYGPGVCDMKGGLVTAIYLLKALHSARLLDTIPVVLICNSDEEIGSPHSTELIRHFAENSCCGLVFECGGSAGEIVTGRKGKCGYFLEVTGKSGHAAFSGENGKTSAVLELAHKIILLEQLNNAGRQMVVNVGRIIGGVAANVVAESGSAYIDTRFVSPADGDFLKNSIEEIASASTIPGTTGTVRTTSSRVPMMQSEGNLCLYEIIRKQAEHLNIPVKNEIRSGVSDANTIAQCAVPVVDGLGPIGALDHSEDEYIVKSSLLQRTKLAMLSVVDIWARRLEKA